MAIIWHWNSCQTAADRAKLCNEMYWEACVGCRLAQFPSPSCSPNTPNLVLSNCPFKIRPNGGKCSSTSYWWALWSRVFSFGCLLLLSTHQQRPNSLPRCAHSSCKCTKIFSGFALFASWKQEAHHKVGLGETPRRWIRNSADILHSINLKTPLTLQYTYLLPHLAPFPSYKPFSAFWTRFAHFSVVFNSILQPTGRSWWRHFWQLCRAACPR